MAIYFDSIDMGFPFFKGPVICGIHFKLIHPGVIENIGGDRRTVRQTDKEVNL